MGVLAGRAAVVLVRTQGPVNLGMVARVCANTGCDDLRLVAPLCSVEDGEARKFAVGARHQLADLPQHADLASAVADRTLVVGTSARPRDADHGAALGLEDLGRLLASRPADRVALVFGNEADGLDGAELGRCQYWLHLDTPGELTSYNLSHAVAIVLHRLATWDAPPAPVLPPAQPLAERERVERLRRFALDLLEQAGYFRRTTRSRWEPNFADMLNRLPLTVREVDLLFGMLAHAEGKARGRRRTRTHPPT